ncbi:FeoA family protein [Methylohalobius crimeensis]|uniref:FeoA family protein n=1 Tax=Methylohalobius crimeensis TaxID=244365 RepID=UPI0003B53321|nr:FeoA family protein [Methylohalobius crimeensis]
MNARILSMVSPGQRIRIVDVPGKRVRIRLLSLGFAPGTTLTVLWNRAGAVIVGRDGDRMAIGRGFAEQILVEPVSAS